MKFVNLIFCLIISIPLLMQILGLRTVDRIPNSEFRRKAKAPKLDTPRVISMNSIIDHYKKYTDQCDNYLNDNLAVKPSLLDIQKLLKVDLLRVSPIPEKVVIGEDNWLFLGDHFGDLVKESKGLKFCTQEELDQIEQNVVNTQKNLDKLGIDYYLAVAPNKHSVYGHKLPIKQNGPSILDQVKSVLIDKVNFIDLKDDYPSMADKMLFDKTNTHFTDIGAFTSAQTLLKRIKVKHPYVSLLNYKDFTESVSYPKTDEITRMLRITGNVERFLLTPKNMTTSRIAENRLDVSSTYRGTKDSFEKRYKNAGKPLKVLVLGDSFMGVMSKFLKESFGEVTFINEHKLNVELIMQDKPDIVIQEIVERSLDLTLSFQY